MSYSGAGVSKVAGWGCKPLVTATPAIVGHERIDLQLRKRRTVRFTVIAGISRDARILGAHRGHRDPHRHQQLLLAARAVRLGFDDELMLCVYRSDPSVALNDAVTGLHPPIGVEGRLGAVVVGAVALAQAPLCSAPRGGMLGEPFTTWGGGVLQAFDARLLLAGQIGFDISFVGGAMAREYRLHGGFELASLTFEVGAGTAPGLGRVAGELDPVDGEHRAAAQALAVADA